MSKGLKKITKVVAKFDLGHQYGKSLGLPDPSGDLFYGDNKALTPAEKQDELAKSQMKQSQAQANQASLEANAQAQASAQAIQLTNDRTAAQSQADDLKPVDTAEPDIQLGGAVDSATARRKKFSTASVGAGQGGPAIRI